ncbi:XRE family transcriptional regulator [Clostridium carboxidivorans P7]|uniref:Transcriptional regulator, XRE family n=1 Tax=Clostridium carboxidivorans P7 TaxID=536227 RepID=C6PXW5_9CLOT|nr:helix-turn-helix transcriptional regulator [Clostridium carboxidivorans]AKN31970.1 XRE family transcriptional regulator [Clostridium carboxidivorans P7]EET85903.1 transcriptional regulator, XRE family [Clostridium carboxidivorans P7]EFG87893.1 helix-turn-helix domain-containing protein [Clostridium carboxidivorans P7]
MEEISIEIGKRIRSFRKAKKMTIQELADQIYKSKATVSKYEKGEIVIDIVTLYNVAKVLRIHVDQLLYCEPNGVEIQIEGKKPAFFQGSSQFYSYIYDGRANKLIRCVMDVLSKTEENRYKVMLYMNIESYENYQECENTYGGYIEHYDALTNIILRNQATPMEQITISMLASFMDSQTKWGLMFGISSRPLMPIAAKMLLSKKPLKQDQKLIDKLTISKEDIRIMKMYNMLAIT